MNRCKIFYELALGCLISGSVLAQPDVLLIAIDDLNDWVSCMDGHPQAHTPNIDRLAARGILFDNAHVQATICNPSRVSFMTGTYPTTTGIINNKGDMKARTIRTVREAQTLPRTFTAGGYRTAGSGKIFHTWKELPNEGHFDVPGPVWNYGYPPNREKLPMRQRWGVVENPRETCFDYDVAEWSIQQLHAWDDDRPDMLMAGFFRPHAPMFAPQEYFDLYPIEEVQLPLIKEDDESDIPEWALNNRPGRRYMQKFKEDPELLRSAVQAYLASTAFVDAQIGRVLDELEASGRADSTVVILFSDHGFALGEKGSWSKHTAWEESTRVPMIIAGPGIPEGEISSAPVQIMDIYPTLVELCGLEAPERLDGNSLVPLLKNPQTAWPHLSATFVENGARAVRSEHFRYILYPDGSEELYDHRADPNEWNNLALDSESLPLRQKMAEQLKTLLPVQK
jgi:choline-sulfatase